jgi:5-methyltetrahydropteroyltriglutamate--homocysteine methyltransferase
MHEILPTTVVGSWPQPAWLLDGRRLLAHGVPRVRDESVWRVPPEWRAEAIEAATLAAIRDQERAGLDVITDGEIGRESYFNHFATALGGVERDRTGEAVNRVGTTSSVPLVTGPVHRESPVELDAARFLRANTDRGTKVTVPGPFTLSQLAQNEHYPDQRALALAYAAAINEELKDLAAAGIDVVQLDEPYLQANVEAARQFAVEAIGRAIDGVDTTTALHTCYGYAVFVTEKSGGYPFLTELGKLPVDQISIEAAQPKLALDVLADLSGTAVVLGVVDLSDPAVETADMVADRLRAALAFVAPERLVAAPDCGLKYLSRSLAVAKCEALVEGAAIVRAELSGGR